MSHHKRCAAKGCPRYVPYDRRWDAIYCCSKCQQREAKRRQKAGVTA